MAGCEPEEVSNPKEKPPNLLSKLPEEILHGTLRYLDDIDLFRFAQACRWSYDKSIPLLWQNVELTDCRTTNPASVDWSDDHDDTPIIRKLLVLASNSWIASQVHTLTHRCHLPPPAIFYELPRISFHGRVHTLRIIFGHWELTRGLLIGLLGHSKGSSVRHIWLENCSIAGIPNSLLQSLDLTRLESLRLRRLPLLANVGRHDFQEVYSRGQFPDWRSDQTNEIRQDGRGGLIQTSVEQLKIQEAAVRNLVLAYQVQASDAEAKENIEAAEKLFESLFVQADEFADKAYTQIPDIGGLITAIQQGLSDEDRSPVNSVKQLLDRNHPDFAPNDTDPFPTFMHILENSSASLTSLNLDWVLFRRTDQRTSLESKSSLDGLFGRLFRLHFPCLRAFQFRNAVIEESAFPRDVYLLDACGPDSGSLLATELCIAWLELHPRLRSLAWPADRFFRATRTLPTELQNRLEHVISSLAHSLEDLRVDTVYSRSGEFKSDDSEDPLDVNRRRSRRRFISEFAARLQKLEIVKMEGGIPRDEKRETIRALRQCPLEKIVMIGVNCPIGNTWGFNGKDIGSLGINEDPNDPDDFGSLEEEDSDEIVRLGTTNPDPVSRNEVFEAEYGWPPAGPFIHTLASYHASTVTELKFCGYRGAPLLWSPTPITNYMLVPLRNFHNLRRLIISLWLHTLWEGEHRDDEILDYWLNTRDASTTALVTTTTEEPTGWAKELATKYAPAVIAARIVTFMGPFISEQAKSQHGGMHVRASFCIGSYGGLFDFDVIIGKDADGKDELREWKGPREELHPERRAEKLRNRRWFGTRVRRDLGDGQRSMSVSL
ncbi:hypothetical protein E4T38_02565 [Aureobasidium subglaciale]|nr:hypothetical protein E4T38_02565 [Aureobasidium subglaciale]KAI5228091.1 hypothetical protein E4T40_02344 [Aureobasidium subglaciale]KAI5231523.1 hypothetical protein E4T41_02564 [Aureobasidium subglaciale]KAI5265397.1 hypothetical protein E4T46_02342 [Aureobasidium subglaciale]